MNWLDSFESQRVSLGRTPTPLERHESLGRALGVELYLKRDDLLDDLGSGNKIRKLEYVVGSALIEGADTLVSAGGAHSNQCKAIAYVSRRVGLQCRLVVCDDDLHLPPRGNYLLDILFGAQIDRRPAREWARVDAHLRAAADAVRAGGRRPYVVPPGASEWPATLGYVRMAKELAEQERTLGLTVDAVVLPTGSGGTQAGIAVGGALLGRPWRITGVCVLLKREYFDARHRHIVARLVEHGVPFPGDAVVQGDFFDGAVGAGYGSITPDDLVLMRDLARDHAFVVDPTYMLKAWRGLCALVADGRIHRGATVVLVHTGGLHGLFAEHPMLIAAARKWLADAP